MESALNRLFFPKARMSVMWGPPIVNFWVVLPKG
jgi:hypothetical protein